MRLRHFETLKPQCPVCRRTLGEANALALGTVLRREGDLIVEGVLLCTNSACQREYPILDGIPMIVAGLRELLSDNLFAVMMRDDLSETIESILGDCSGPASYFDAARHQVSCYARDHYGLYDPLEPSTDPRPGAASRVLNRGLDLAERLPEGPLVDLGCSVGGTTFELAERTGRLVLGIDLNLAMLRVAAKALLRGQATYPRKRTGVVYDKRTVSLPFKQAENVDFWAADVAALPFASDTFALASLLNVIDCVRAPREVLVEAARVLGPGAAAIITSPYDWSASATPIETWLGGHSQRSPSHGDGATVLRALLSQSGHPAAIPNLGLESEIAEIPWHVRLHDRSTVGYGVHVVVARKQSIRA
jgi:SAM-dependent methyltransferase/uncharacterized protein YbaR (Trm112 family)